MEKNAKEIIAYLSEFVTPQRYELFTQISKFRTRYITVVLENIYQSHNASAVLRSCDCFGIQDVHIIENKNKYQVNPEVALGASKWLNLKMYNSNDYSTTDAISSLKKQGYRIVATTPHTNDVNLEEFDLTKGKVALLFGTELEGLTEEALNQADEFLKIPMVGFTESLNISVCAAITIHHLTLKLRKLSVDWALTEEEMNEILINWLQTSIKNGDKIYEQFVK